MPQPPPLAYRPPRPPRQRKPIWRWVILALLLLLLAAVYQWTPWVCIGAHRLYWQRQCLAWTLAPQQVILSETDDSTADPAGEVSHDFHLPPPGWAMFKTLTDGTAGTIDRPLFLGRLTLANGTCRVVAVGVNGRLTSEWQGLTLWGTVYEPGDMSQPAHMAASMALAHLEIGPSAATQPEPARQGSAPHVLRIFAPQLDAADASHFSFTLEWCGRRSTVDGWLTGPATLRLENRQAPDLLQIVDRYGNRRPQQAKPLSP